LTDVAFDLALLLLDMSDELFRKQNAPIVCGFFSTTNNQFFTNFRFPRWCSWLSRCSFRRNRRTKRASMVWLVAVYAILFSLNSLFHRTSVHLFASFGALDDKHGNAERRLAKSINTVR
jgi:hypothetical protein